jgi:4-hydroxy-tetrahydrodipicolinate synthase
MAIPPISVAVGEDELMRYYERILAATTLPLVIQDASGYVGRPMSIQMQAELFNKHGGRVMFKPEAAPIGPRLTALRKATNGHAAIFEGSGGIALVESFRRGIAGTMPGAEIIEVIVALWRALLRGDDAQANAIHAPLAALISLQGSLDAFLAVEKHILHRRGIFVNTVVRGPTGYMLDEFTRHEIDRLVDELQRIVVTRDA